MKAENRYVEADSFMPSPYSSSEYVSAYFTVIRMTHIEKLQFGNRPTIEKLPLLRYDFANHFHQAIVIRIFHIDLNLLMTLSLLLQTRSVSATARRLGASQPTASRALSRLRELFDDPLLIRTNRGMELTRKAEELIEPLQDWLSNTNSLFVSREFDPSKIERRFRIAATDFGVTSVLVPTLARLQMEAPGATFDIISYSDSMFSKLTSGELDLILTGLDPDFSAIYGRHLFTDHQVCVMRADHPMLENGGGPIDLEGYLQWPHIGVMIGEGAYDPIGTHLGERAPERRLIASLPYFHTVPQLATTTDAIITVGSRVASCWADLPNLAIVEAPADFPTFDYWALYHERSRRDPAISWISNVMSEVSAKMNG